jgi:hypothetical protein
MPTRPTAKQIRAAIEDVADGTVVVERFRSDSYYARLKLLDPQVSNHLDPPISGSGMTRWEAFSSLLYEVICWYAPPDLMPEFTKRVLRRWPDDQIVYMLSIVPDVKAYQAARALGLKTP